MKIRSLLIGLATAGTLLAACTSGSTNDVAVTTNDGPITLRLLAHESFTPTETIFDDFTLQTGIKVELVRSSDAGTLVTKAVLASGNPEGDVLWGVDNTLLSRALDADVFVPYVTVHRDDLDAVAVALAPDGAVTPVDSGDVCINYDKAWFAERNITPPLTLQALTSSTYRNLLVTPNPVSSSPGLAFLLATIAEFGDGWQQWWETMRTNNILIVESWSDAYYGHFTAASDGERPLVVSYATSPPAEVLFADPRPTQAPTAVAALTCFRQYEFAGILRGTKHEPQAQLLIDFLVSRQFQEDLPLTQFVWPINNKASVPKEFLDYALRPENPLTIGPAIIAQRRAEWLEQFSDIMLR
ncbi:MAG: thiamine ABC transporter substrate-binding protein [Ilumatobacteraceae bacterium]|nr:thiamine ABC transporter substrate-binding protein [Ilumatobacteraceae bacterium]